MNKDVLVGFFVGLGRGTAGALLAPVSGAQTRQRIKETAAGEKQHLHERDAALKGHAAGVIDYGKQAVG